MDMCYCGGQLKVKVISFYIDWLEYLIDGLECKRCHLQTISSLQSHEVEKMRELVIDSASLGSPDVRLANNRRYINMQNIIERLQAERDTFFQEAFHQWKINHYSLCGCDWQDTDWFHCIYEMPASIKAELKSVRWTVNEWGALKPTTSIYVPKENF